MTVVAIVVVVCSVLVPILLRLGGVSAARVKLVLEQVDGVVFQNAEGRRFEVHELEA
jgi:hypothetical protein